MEAVTRALKEIGDERGRKAEEKFFQAMVTSSLKEMPRWLFYVYRASAREDKKEGKDAIVVTEDVGKIFIQIKSSAMGVMRFRKGRHYHRRNKFLGILVIHERDTLEDVRAKTKVLISKIRQKILNKRLNKADW